MKRISTLFTAFLIAGSFSSFGQAVSPANTKKVAAVFSKDVQPPDLSKYSLATFAGDNFWREETLFGSVAGVVCVVPGYAGGGKTFPTYKDVETGTTGHVQTVNIYYDSTKVSYATLLEVFFDSQEDPTQAADEGPQYRNYIFYRSNVQKNLAQQNIDKLTNSGLYKKPIATELVRFTLFWPAAENIQHYFYTHTDEPYVAKSINTIAKYQKAHPALIKPDHNFSKVQ